MLILEKEIILKRVNEFLDHINKKLPESMELEFEGYYKRGFFVTKKRYALIEDDKIIVKGLEFVRRDWAPIAKKTQEKVLYTILKEGSPKKAEKIIRKVIKDIKEGNLNLEDLVIHTQITKKLDEYKQIGPHVIAAKKALRRGRRIDPGAIIRYIIVKGSRPISERAEPIEDVSLEDYDPQYYIEHQVLPAVSRIMKALGYSDEDLKSIIYGERQASLDSFL
nr:DNA polymerase domain-containing protein [Methanothermus fervidus]